MAKSSEASWLPSGGVLVVAAGALLVALILINIYSGYIKSDSEAGSKLYLQARVDIDPNTIIKESHLTRVAVPAQFHEAIQNAVDNDGIQSVLGHKAPRRIAANEFLWYRDFVGEAVDEKFRPPPGYELVAVPINPANNPGTLLQPGGAVTLRGDFDFDADPKREDVRIEDVISNVPVKAVGGSTKPAAKTQAYESRSYDNIHIMVRSAQARQLLQIQKALVSKRFTVSIVAAPEGAGAGESQINKVVLDLVEKPKAAPAPAAP